MTFCRKTWIFAICAFLAFSCFVTPLNEDEQTRYTPDGRPFVHLTIGTGDTNRALTDTLARAGINYYEVAFYDGTDYYRASWNRGRSGRLYVPTFNYDSSANAILFAGAHHENDFTLLAIGMITSADGVPGAEITVNTKGVEFTLVPLLSDVKPDTASSFHITAPPIYATASVSGPFPLFPLSSANPERITPLFLIPPGSDDIEASFAIHLPGNISFDDYKNGLYTAGQGMVENRIPSGNPPLLEFPYNVYGELDISIISPEADKHFSDNFITFAISTVKTDISFGPDNFYSKIFFEVPVNAIKNETSADGIQPLTWHIRGGLLNDLYDEGSTLNSLGGAIVLGIGDVDFNTLP